MVTTTGSQTPRVLNRSPHHHVSYGKDASDLSRSVGLILDPWQRMLADGCLAEDKDGILVHGIAGISVPRQNGKNGAVEAVQLYKLFVQGRHILHTAHEVDSARGHFMRLVELIEDDDDLMELVISIRKANGQEAIFIRDPDGDPRSTKTWAKIEFSTRTRQAKRGRTFDDLFVDEAQELTDTQYAALLFATSAGPAGNRQVIFLGTPPPDDSPYEVFPRIRQAGLDGDPRTFWAEWSIPDDADLKKIEKDPMRYVAKTNPAFNVRLPEHDLQDEMPPKVPVDFFARERLGWWKPRLTHEGDLAFKPTAWSCLAIPRDEVPTEGRKVFAVHFSWDGSSVSLAAAIRPDDGPIHVDPLKTVGLGEGTDWLVNFLKARASTTAQIVITGRGLSQGLVADLREAGVRNKRLILVPPYRDYASAHSLMEQAIRSGELTHAGDKKLSSTVETLTKVHSRQSQTFRWGSTEDGVDTSIFTAMTLAYWGAKTTRRRPSSSSGSGATIL